MEDNLATGGYVTSCSGPPRSITRARPGSIHQCTKTCESYAVFSVSDIVAEYVVTSTLLPARINCVVRGVGACSHSSKLIRRALGEFPAVVLSTDIRRVRNAIARGGHPRQAIEVLLDFDDVVDGSVTIG